MFNLFGIDGGLAIRVDGTVDGDSKGTEEESYVKTGFSLVFQGSTNDDTLHDGETILMLVLVD